MTVATLDLGINTHTVINTSNAVYLQLMDNKLVHLSSTTSIHGGMDKS